MQTSNRGAIPAVPCQETGEETCVELRCMSIIDRNLRRAEGLDQTADEIEDLDLKLLGHQVREFGAEKLFKLSVSVTAKHEKVDIP